jgi:S1-C subfamily serine protease
VIEELNGRAVHSGGDLRDAAAAVPAGEDITLQLRHGGEPLVLTLHPADGNGEVKSRLGVTVERGLVVTEVSPDSPAEAAGLVRGDVIEDAHGHPVHTGDQLHAIIHAQPAGAEVMLVVTRNGERLELMAHLDGE